MGLFSENCPRLIPMSVVVKEVQSRVSADRVQLANGGSLGTFRLFYGDCIVIIFPESLLRTSKYRES